MPVLSWLRGRRDARLRAEGEALLRRAEALQSTTRQIYLNPSYDENPIQSEIDDWELSGLVWHSQNLPVSDATRARLRKLRESFDAAVESGAANEQRQVHEEALRLVHVLRDGLGPEWRVGFFSSWLAEPVWDLAELPDEEWRDRFHRET